MSLAISHTGLPAEQLGQRQLDGGAVAGNNYSTAEARAAHTQEFRDDNGLDLTRERFTQCTEGTLELPIDIDGGSAPVPWRTADCTATVQPGSSSKQADSTKSRRRSTATNSIREITQIGRLLARADDGTESRGRWSSPCVRFGCSDSTTRS
jgi:hypothetical protein